MAGEDEAYRQAVKRLPCCMCGKPPLNEAHHHRHAGAGGGQKAHDHLSMPLCLRCHHDLHALSGAFKGFTREMITEWQDKRVGLTWFLIKGTYDGCPLLPVVVPKDSKDAALANTATDFLRWRLCPGCRSESGEHTFRRGCTLREELDDEAF